VPERLGQLISSSDDRRNDNGDAARDEGEMHVLQQRAPIPQIGGAVRSVG